MSNQSKLAITPELLTAQLSGSNPNTAELKADPRAFLFANYNADVPHSINVVENTSSEVNLALPYYAELENISAEKFKDEDMGDVAGGDIILAIVLAVSLAGAAVAVTATAVGIGANEAVKAHKNK